MWSTGITCGNLKQRVWYWRKLISFTKWVGTSICIYQIRCHAPKWGRMDLTVSTGHTTHCQPSHAQSYISDFISTNRGIWIMQGLSNNEWRLIYKHTQQFWAWHPFCPTLSNSPIWKLAQICSKWKDTYEHDIWHYTSQQAYSRWSLWLQYICDD